MSDFNEKSTNEKNAFAGDVEAGRRGSVTVQGRKMSRIGPPPRGSIVDTGDMDLDDVQARLVAEELGNTIQYRTCSWQKVPPDELSLCAPS